MNLVYNSDSYAVVQISLEQADSAPGDGEGASTSHADVVRGGYEIVDKAAKKGIFIDGALAQRFREGVQALAEEHEPSTEEIDDYIAGYTQLAQQPLTLH
ncbi:MAG TPA: DUF3567 domain-containing protein [Ideonella sp.]|uniref:BTH_I0359 family protein n=1 Tax=Ideonella sp. TaxID=1929293 RepID=UPI002E3293A5|nr:DUF3567 domain-containing protein [Ideonella sp.]HEX5682524.1 DUF3567 domain-containing protein [Ideonella sp.]